MPSGVAAQKLSVALWWLSLCVWSCIWSCECGGLVLGREVGGCMENVNSAVVVQEQTRWPMVSLFCR